MGLFKMWGRMIFRPYTELGRTAKRTGRYLLSTLNKAKSNVEPEDGYRMLNAANSKEAFELLFKENGWTEEKLEAQLKGVRLAKWLALVSLWVLICLVFCIPLMFDATLYRVIALFFGLLLIVNSIARSLKFVIFQTQIELRDLISFQEFMARKDKWSRVFS